jgi:hypothetical protein
LSFFNFISQNKYVPLEPPSGSWTIRKQAAPPPKYDVNGCQWLVGATRLLFLRSRWVAPMARTQSVYWVISRKVNFILRQDVPPLRSGKSHRRGEPKINWNCVHTYCHIYGAVKWPEDTVRPRNNPV